MHHCSFAVLAALGLAMPAASQSLSLLIQLGDEVPDTGGATIAGLHGFQVNERDEFAAFVQMEGGTPTTTPDTSRGLMLSTATGKELILRGNDPAYTEGSRSYLFDPTFSFFPAGQYGFAGFELQDDRVVFWTRVKDTMFSAFTNVSLFEWTPDGIEHFTDDESPWDELGGSYSDETFRSAFLFPGAPAAVGFEMWARGFPSGSSTRTFYVGAPGMPPLELLPLVWQSNTGESFTPEDIERDIPAPIAPSPDIVMGRYLDTNEGAIFVLQGAQLVEIMREGQPAAGMPGATYSFLHTLHTGAGGSLVRGDATDAAGIRRNAIWHVAENGAITKLISAGEPSPYLGGISPRGIRRAHPLQDALFVAITDHDPNSPSCDETAAALLVNTNGSITEVPLYGQPLPGSADIVPMVSCGDIGFVAASPTRRDFYFDIYGDDRTHIYSYDPDANAFNLFAAGGEAFDFSPNQDGSDMRVLDHIGPPTFAYEKLYFYLYWGDQTMFGAFVYDPDAQTCPADTNNDGVVTPADYNAWILAYNSLAPECDQNGDGNCTPADYNAWILNFNAGC